jgi:hypothetical protein
VQERLLESGEGGMTMKIIVVPDGRCFFAQGLSEDYGCQGDSVDDAVSNFKAGMESTIHARRQRGLDDLSEPPPQSVIDDLKTTHGAVEMEVEIDMERTS